MNTYIIWRRARLSLLLCGSIFTLNNTAFADVFGRLNLTVKSAEDDKPVAGAKVILHDQGGIRPDISLTTGENGKVTTPLLENRSWKVSVNAGQFSPASKEVRVSSDTTSDVELGLEPVETTIKVTTSKTLLRANETSNAAIRDNQFTKTYPVAAQNPQQLTGLLVSNPGFVQDSANQVHPRGEHSATSIYMQGFQLGGAAQGRFGPLIDPQSLENLDIMTGAFAPEYAGGAAILNSSVRSGTTKPFANVEVDGGSYQTGLTSFSFGGQAGAPIGASDQEGNQSKIFSYFLSGSARDTDNALEAPQPGRQSVHNHGSSENILGRFDLKPSSEDSFSLIVNGSPAKTQVANRTGLPDKYAPYGQGYGFGGALSALDAASQGIVSQDLAGQDIYQKDRNAFGVVQWRHDFSDKISSLLSFGIDQSKLDTLNNNPAVDLNNLPEDSSIEYNPEVTRDAKHKQVSASVSIEQGAHTIKVGGQYSKETANDSYQLTPASQLAVNALFAADSRLVASGMPVFDAAGEPVVDANGNQVYQLAPGAAAQRLGVDSDGYYAAGYIQDTWKILEPLTANYGVRFDTFKQSQNLGQETVDKNQFSPRLNLSYAFYPTWVARASYDRLFIEPPLSQGAIIGEPIKPERVHQYDISLEKEITPLQKAKVAYYVKHIRDQVDTGLLIPSTQMGLYTSVNLDSDTVHGFEFSYDLLADHGYGPSAYVAYAYSTAKPGGFDNTGEAVDAYNDHDQRHTVSAGAAYTLNHGESFGADFYYGSGLASSTLTDGGSRHSRTRVDLSISSSPKMLFGKGGLKFTVSNLFDNRNIINFNSAFSGTRFQQAQMFLLSTFFNF